VINLEKVSKVYYLGKAAVYPLAEVSLTVEKGQFVSLMGPSGSGKSTLLNLLGGVDRPSQGKAVVNGIDLGKASNHELVAFRRHVVGFLFQSFHLLPHLSAVENVELPLFFSGISKQQSRKMAERILIEVGLVQRLHHTPGALSGGEQQRVSLARALVHDPLLLLADEPTGNLDSKSGRSILELILAWQRRVKGTILLVTHDLEVASMAQRMLTLRDGRLIQEHRT